MPPAVAEPRQRMADVRLNNCGQAALRTGLGRRSFGGRLHWLVVLWSAEPLHQHLFPPGFVDLGPGSVPRNATSSAVIPWPTRCG